MDPLEVGPATTDGDGHVVPVRAVDHLCGPPGVVQGGLAAVLLAGAATGATGGTVSRVAARLHRPTPTDTPLRVTLDPATDDDTAELAAVGAADGAAATWAGTVAVVGGDHGSEVADDDITVRGHVVVGGRPDGSDDHDDLVAIALRDPLPRPQAVPAAPDCVVCGARNSHGLHLFPGWFSDGAVVEAWEGDDEVAGPRGMFVRPEVVAAVLDCPTVWATRDHCRANGFGGALLGGFDVTWYSRLPVGESVRIAAVLDHADGRKMSARAGLVGADGLLYAVASALQIGVATMPGADPDLDPFGDDLDD